MRATFISTTNEKFNYLIGTEGELNIGVKINFVHDFSRLFTSSLLQKVEYKYQKDYKYAIVRFVTLNSEYEFRIEGE